MMQKSLLSDKNKLTGDPRANMSTQDEVMNMYYSNQYDEDLLVTIDPQTTSGTKRHQA